MGAKAKRALERIPEMITPAAESYAKANGLYESVMRTKQIVRDVMPGIRALTVHLEEDPDEGGYPTICFDIKTPEPVDRLLPLDEALEDALLEGVPAKDRLHLTFHYQFE